MLETLLQKGDTEERCGVVMKDGNAVELQNVAGDPAGSFEMPSKAFLELVKTGEVEATWHTHPKSSPVLSGADYETFLNWPDLKHHVIGMEKGEVVVLTYIVDDGVVITCD